MLFLSDFWQSAVSDRARRDRSRVEKRVREEGRGRRAPWAVGRETTRASPRDRVHENDPATRARVRRKTDSLFIFTECTRVTARLLSL